MSDHASRVDEIRSGHGEPEGEFEHVLENELNLKEMVDLGIEEMLRRAFLAGSHSRLPEIQDLLSAYDDLLLRHKHGWPLDVPLYDKNFGDDRACECGHPYYRHFDSYDFMAPIGCKYCYGEECQGFKEKK